MKCSECGSTHALIPSSIVPYDRIPASCQFDIVCAYENDSDPYAVCAVLNDTIDEDNVKSVLLRYKSFWRERLKSASICLTSLQDVIPLCFSFYFMQFMQIHQGDALLFSLST